MRRAARRRACRPSFFRCARAGIDDPADRERLPALRPHFDRHLIGGATDTARAHFDRRHYVIERLLENRDGILLDLLLDRLERAIDDRLGDRLLALAHDGIHETADLEVPEFRIGNDLAALGAVTAGHRLAPRHFGRLAP